MHVLNRPVLNTLTLIQGVVLINEVNRKDQSDSVKMHHVFRLVSHVIYHYFTMFCHCYVLFCPCFRYLLIMEHMRVRSKKESEMVKKKCKNVAFWCMAFAMVLWRPPWHQDTSAPSLKLMVTVICLQ